MNTRAKQKPWLGGLLVTDTGLGPDGGHGTKLMSALNALYDYVSSSWGMEDVFSTDRSGIGEEAVSFGGDDSGLEHVNRHDTVLLVQ